MKTPEQQKGCPYCGTLVKDLICDKPPIMSQQIFENRERLVSDYVKASAAELVEKAREWCKVVTDPAEGYPNEGEYNCANKLLAFLESELIK